MNKSVKISNHTKHPCFNNCQKEVINYEILGFLQQCWWEFRSSGMWCCVVGWMAPTVSQECSAMQQQGVKSQKTWIQNC